MDMLKSDGRMEGWLYLILSNRFGLQYSRKRFFILEENCLNSFKSKLPTSDSQKPLRSAIVESCIRVTAMEGRTSVEKYVCNKQVFSIFTLYNTSNYNDRLKLGASNPEEAAKWKHSLQDVAMEPGTNSKRRWQPFRLNDSKCCSEVSAIMAVGVIEGTCEAVFRTFMSLDLSRSEWDFCFYNGNVVEHLDGHTYIIHIQLFSYRRFC